MRMVFIERTDAVLPIYRMYRRNVPPKWGSTPNSFRQVPNTSPAALSNRSQRRQDERPQQTGTMLQALRRTLERQTDRYNKALLRTKLHYGQTLVNKNLWLT